MIQGRYAIYVKVTDEAGNACISEIPYWFDNEPPTGRISAKNQGEITETNELSGISYITGTPDLDTGSPVVSNIMSLHQKGENGAAGEKVCDIYDNASGSTSGANSKAFDTRKTANGTYVLKMNLTDAAGNRKTITKEITIANRIAKPQLTAATSKGGETMVQFNMPSSVKAITGLQYKVEEKDADWTDITGITTLSGTFTAVLPDKEGTYILSVRAIDQDGLPGEERTINIRVDKTLPTAEIAEADQGIIRGSAADEEFSGWKIYIKEKSAADESYREVLSGDTEKEDALFGDIGLYNENYAAGWYTIKLEVMDIAGNVKTVTCDIYKDENCPAPTIVDPAFRIERPDDQNYDSPQIIFGTDAAYMQLTAGFFRSFTLSSADWYIENQKAEENSQTSSLKTEDGKGKYEEGRPYCVAAVTHGLFGGAAYSSTLIENARAEKISFNEKGEGLVTMENMVSFTLRESEEDCTYYAKTTGDFVEIKAGETVEILSLSDGSLTSESLTIKAVKENGMPSEVMLTLDRLETETFVIDGMENYRPKGLSAKDKINYKTYLKWKIPERLPEDISYEIYRSTEKGFDPLLQEPLAEVNAGCFVEPNADYETRFYYRVRAVKRDNKGAVISYSAFSDEAESTVVDENEFIKRLGYKEYWNYADFQMPSGSGAIEKSQGNFFYEQTDLTLPNEQLPVELTRTYNSMASSKSAFGIGWNHNYDIELLSTDYSDKLETGQRLVMKDSSGTLFFFTKEPNASGEYISSMGKYLTLRKFSGEEGKITIKLPDKSTGSQDGKVEKTIEAAYLVETKENLSYYFSASGQLVYMEEPNGNFLLFTYDLYTGLVKSVMTSNNLEMTFVYNDKAGTDPATVKKVIMPDGSGMAYTYADGRLSKATKLGTGGEIGASFTYGYDGNGNLKIMTDAAGNVYQIEADRDGSVKEAVYPDGESLLFTRSKGAEGMEQTVTAVKKDGFTLSEETAAFDVASGNCLEVVDGNGLVTAYSYRDEMLAKTTEQVTYEVIGEETGLVTEQIDTYVTTTEYDDTLNVTEEATEISQWEELVEYEYDNTGEFDEDFPSREITRRGSTVTGDFTYLYDIFGNLTSQFDNITGVRTDYDYYTEEDGDIDDFLYGEIESETESINGVVTSTVTYSYTYDSAGNKTETTTETVGDTVTVTVTKYDLMGRELESTVTVCGVLKSMGFYTYDSFGRVTRATEQEGSRITTVVTSYTANDAVSSQTTTTTENGKSQTESVSYTYDNMNRVANTVTTTGGKQRSESTSIHYGSIDKNAALGDTEKVYAKITTTVSGSQVSKTFTDGSGNVLRQDSQGISTYYTYDKSGNCLSQVTLGEGQTMADTAITAYLYDARGNQIRTIRDADYDREAKGCRPGEFSIQSKTFYNDQDQAVRVDHSSFFNSDTMAYDIEGRLTEFVQDANVSAVKTSVSYADPTEGNEASSVTITMANGTKSRTVTNLSGQVISESTIGNAADGEITKTYGYAEDGTLSKETDAAGNYRTYEYDSLDREIAINYFDAAGAQTLRTEFSYDTGGNVSEMKDYAFESGSKTLYRWTETRYDESGNLISEAEVSCEGAQPSEGQLEARRITYAYDNDDRLVRVSYPSGFDSQVEALEYAYDDYGRLSEITAVTSTGRAVLREYTHNVRGQIETIKDNREALGGTGYALKTYGYDKLDRNTSITVTDSERDGEAEKYIYTYNYDDQIVEEVRKNVYSTETDKQINERRYYEYDNLGRMVLGNGIRYTYDTVGNCLTETEKGITTTSTYNSLNQLITKGSAVYSYDANGNQIKEVDGNAVKDFSYDADNRLDTVTYTENGAEVFRQENLYNGQGQRIAKYEQVQGKDSEETHYAYGCGSVVFTDGSVGKKSLNLLGDAGNIIAAERDAETGKDYYFYNKDIRASTTSILDSSGNCANSYECSDFGETTVHGDLYNEICYTGGIYDASTGLYYLNARYYDPADKRFLTEDTYRGSENDPNTLHLYAYCANNPVNYVDPSGHFGIFFIPWIAKGAAIVIGGITLTYLTTTKEFQEAWGRAIRGIENTLSGASEYVKSKAKSLSKAIGKSFSKAKRKYKDKYEEHHIVARTKTRAKPARDILNKVGIKIENPINKIKIKKGLHKRLHRNDYFDIVNSMIQSAYDKKGNKKRKVENALKNLRAFITALDKAAPF
ncbi:RHS repeat-associated core domain-containing protein [Emergencia sp. 1XD21-10]|uniref:RHS repeat-associated core domain-containing protein n=1 Tax=Emergencia sp. 1XD21-10 TaxID=2304569 RepID=UPI00137ACF3A|nr:hypothetical protein [Emergencia sp. 1XD21-10]